MYLTYILRLEYHFYNNLFNYDINNIIKFTLINNECNDIVNDYGILNDIMYKRVIKHNNNRFLHIIDLYNKLSCNEYHNVLLDENIKENLYEVLDFNLNFKDLIDIGNIQNNEYINSYLVNLFLQFNNIILNEKFIKKCIIKFKNYYNKNFNELLYFIFTINYPLETIYKFGYVYEISNLFNLPLLYDKFLIFRDLQDTLYKDDIYDYIDPNNVESEEEESIFRCSLKDF